MTLHRRKLWSWKFFRQIHELGSSRTQRVLKEEADIEEQKDLVDEEKISQITDQLAIAVLTREELEATS